MEFQLQKSVQIMNKEAGQYEDADIVVVSFTGKKGLKTIKRIQDMIFKSFNDTQTKEVSEEQKEALKGEDITVNEVFDLLEMMGVSEKLFDEVTGALKAFATIEGKKLSEDLQEQLDTDDLDNLYRKVLETFLLPKVTSKMNNMSK